MPAKTTKIRNMPEAPINLPPSAEILEGLSVADRQILQRLLSEPQDWVDHPSFAEAGTEQTLFGSNPLTAKVRTPVDPAAVPSLSAAEERFFFERYNYARFRVCRVLEQFEGRALDAHATAELLHWGRTVLKIRAEIIQINIPLVLSMAKRSRLNSLDFNELVSEGNLALIRSVEKFDVSRGFKFSTYACRAILKSFSRVAMKAGRYRGLFPVELNAELERSDFLEVKRETVEEDCVAELKHILEANLAQLNDVEQRVIQERFSIGRTTTPDHNKTLEQVGQLIGVTKERVRQIQNKALQKIRVALEEQILVA